MFEVFLFGPAMQSPLAKLTGVLHLSHWIMNVAQAQVWEEDIRCLRHLPSIVPLSWSGSCALLHGGLYSLR